MSKEDLEIYLLDQAKIEVEHTRSWPVKIMAFYVTINLGLIASLIAANAKGQLQLTDCARILVALPIWVLFIWGECLLIKNHRSYLEHRNVQIKYQAEHFSEDDRRTYSLPDTWFTPVKVSFAVRWHGWGFYGAMMLIVTGFTTVGLWCLG